MAVDTLELTLRELLDLTESEPAAPGAGSAAACAIAIASSLVIKVARRSSERWPDGPGVAAQAAELRDRLPALDRQDADSWLEALAALESSDRNGSGDGELAKLLSRAADLPLAIAETGADVAELARLCTERCDKKLLGEAVAGAALANAGVQAAAFLVALNLGTRPGDERSERVERVVHVAAEAAARALAAEP